MITSVLAHLVTSWERAFEIFSIFDEILVRFQINLSGAVWDSKGWNFTKSFPSWYILIVQSAGRRVFWTRPDMRGCVHCGDKVGEIPRFEWLLPRTREASQNRHEVTRTLAWKIEKCLSKIHQYLSHELTPGSLQHEDTKIPSHSKQGDKNTNIKTSKKNIPE